MYENFNREPSPSMLFLDPTASIVTLGAGFMKWRKLENFPSVTTLVENKPSRKEFEKYWNPKLCLSSLLANSLYYSTIFSCPDDNESHHDRKT